MRYGENPHQKAALYKTSDKRKGITNSKKLQGKELSYNNVNDADAAFELICEFKKPAVAIIKHANPCGVAENDDLNSAWEKALQTDPVSAFGGIVSINRELTKDLALKMKSLFLEVIIAPSVDREALEIFADKPNVRILTTGSLPSPEDKGLLLKSISGGILVQSRDYKVLNSDNIKIVTKRKPTKKEIDDLMFAWKVAKHTKSNAIVYAKNLQTVGIGAGQMSRIDSTSIANEKAKKASKLAKLKTSMARRRTALSRLGYTHGVSDDIIEMINHMSIPSRFDMTRPSHIDMIDEAPYNMRGSGKTKKRPLGFFSNKVKTDYYNIYF